MGRESGGGSNSGGQSRVIVHRDANPNKADSHKRDPSVQVNIPNDLVMRQSRVVPTHVTDTPTPAPLPQRVGQSRARNGGVPGSQNSHNMGVRSVNMCEPNGRDSGTQFFTISSWADDPVSDTEMVSMADATDTTAPWIRRLTVST